MTVRELMNLLNKIEDKSKPLVVALRQTNRAYPIADVAPYNRDYLTQTASGVVQLDIMLPDGMYTLRRKN